MNAATVFTFGMNVLGILLGIYVDTLIIRTLWKWGREAFAGGWIREISREQIAIHDRLARLQ